ncbi:DUF1643 domain-containing protein [Cerasicoccus frondis]|uniref:DUF1643 domain-containing protein n=1 Tax=Cerasicoccus frondis TaxID=490090 RepID=UPI002852ABF8|nr:DUF1643 domain-containing protein [Cerasicoccus frondis]
MKQNTMSLPGELTKSATFSPCRRWRYDLWRRWGKGDYCMFIGLNPSTADETQNDPTIRRCINFARDWGYDALCMTNLFGFRATDPRVMKEVSHPQGPENVATIRRLAEDAGIVVAAWGVHGVHRMQNQRVVNALKDVCELKCLGQTKDGHPKHPLYIPKATKPQPYIWHA